MPSPITLPKQGWRRGLAKARPLMTKKSSFTPYLFLTPALLVIATFVVYPIFAVIYYSFTDYNIINPPTWVGLSNYIQLLKDTVFWQSLAHSFIYLLVTPALLFLCIFLAIIVNRKLPGINASVPSITSRSSAGVSR